MEEEVEDEERGKGDGRDRLTSGILGRSGGASVWDTVLKRTDRV